MIIPSMNLWINIILQKPGKATYMLCNNISIRSLVQINKCLKSPKTLTERTKSTLCSMRKLMNGRYLYNTQKRGVFRIQSNIYDAAFLRKKLTAFSR